MPANFFDSDSQWALFATWVDLLLAVVGLLLITLIAIWLRQQTVHWFRIILATFLIALTLCIAAYSLFVVPIYSVGCPGGCPGWRGFPIRFARIELNGISQIGTLDFLLNLLMLWLMWMGAVLIWGLIGYVLSWSNRSWRSRLLLVLLMAILPWALLPRLIDPPQPTARGEELRLAVNAIRSAEYTYGITGPWVQRLALEDMRTIVPEVGAETLFGDTPVNQVCLRGYTYFYLPWLRYRITLDPSGVTALSLAEVPLEGSCWE
ncbi:MAG: hypothetical protein WDZ49_13680 [Litorilinea sp.]